MITNNMFNIGVNLSLGDMELGLEYLNNTKMINKEAKDNKITPPVMEKVEDSMDKQINTDNLFDEDEDIFDEENDTEEDNLFEDDEDTTDEEDADEDADFFIEDEEENDTEEDEETVDINLFADEDNSSDTEEEDDFFIEDEEDENEAKQKPCLIQKETENSIVNTSKNSGSTEENDLFADEEEDNDIDEDDEFIVMPDKPNKEKTDTSVNKITKVNNEETSSELTLKEKELALKEKELALKEKELEIKLKQIELERLSATEQSNVKKENDTIQKDKVEEEKENKIRPNIVPDRQALINKYSEMSMDNLYRYVKGFMLKNGVREHPIESKVLNDKFGAININKLIKKSYLIKLNNNSITCNR